MSRLLDWVRRSRGRARADLANERANLSEQEKQEVDRLHEEHLPGRRGKMFEPTRDTGSRPDT